MIVKCILANNQKIGMLILILPWLLSSSGKLIRQITLFVWISPPTFMIIKGKKCSLDSFQQQHSVTCTWLSLLTLPLSTYILLLLLLSKFHNLVGLILKLLNVLIANIPSSWKSMWFMQSIKCCEYNLERL